MDNFNGSVGSYTMVTGNHQLGMSGTSLSELRVLMLFKLYSKNRSIKKSNYTGAKVKRSFSTLAEMVAPSGMLPSKMAIERGFSICF